MQLNNSVSLLDHCEIADDGKDLFVTPRHSASILSSQLNKFESTRTWIQKEAQRRGLKSAYISRGAGKQPYQILAFPPALFSLFSEVTVEAVGRSNPKLAHSLEPLLQADSEGKLITIVSMLNDRCKHSTVPPKRGLRLAPDWTGYDYRQSWKLDGTNLSNEYLELIKKLYDDDVVPNYEYDLIRPDDGARLRYQTSYTLVDFFGEPVRVGISDPEAFTLVEAGRS
jgi:hypothetical protein